jgi:hypothetical protein
MDESFSALVRGPSSRLPRGYLYLVPVWCAVAAGAFWYGWSRLVGTLPLWYGALLGAGVVVAAILLTWVLMSVRHLAFRADANGIRLGIRSSRKRPRQRQAHLWWADVQEITIAPRHYGSRVAISLGPSARIVRRRPPWRQGLLMIGMLLLPLCLGRGTPKLTEPRNSAPQYRVRLYEVKPEELGLALAALALPSVQIVVMSRRRGPQLARRPEPAAALPPQTRPVADLVTADLVTAPSPAAVAPAP